MTTCGSSVPDRTIPTITGRATKATARRPERFDWLGHAADIRWSTWYSTDIERGQLQHPVYTVVQVNNVFNNPEKFDDPPRWTAFERPQVIIQYFNGRSGELLYAESIVANK